MGSIHIGKKIKEVVDKSPLSVTALAVRINRTRTVVYDIFERATIDTGLLQKIGNVLEHDFFHYYNHESPWIAKEDKGNYIRKNELLSVINEELQSCKRQLAELEKKCALLEKVNTLLEEKSGNARRKRPS